MARDRRGLFAGTTGKILSTRCSCRQRRPGREVITTHAKLAAFYLYLHRIRRRVERDPSPYTDPSLMPIDGDLLLTRRKEKVLTGATA